MEFACQVWHTSLTEEQNVILESLQERDLKMICPSMSYDKALEWSNLPILCTRREAACMKLFLDMHSDCYKLHYLLPKERQEQAKYTHIQYVKQNGLETPL